MYLVFNNWYLMNNYTENIMLSYLTNNHTRAVYYFVFFLVGMSGTVP